MLKKYILSSKYAESFDYLFLWALIFALGFTGANASYGLQVVKKFDILSKINMLAMFVTLSCSYVGILKYRITGGLAALIIGLAIEALILWYYFAKFVFFSSTDHIATGAERSKISRLLRSRTVQ
jgi:O-antigen/teichoic acid export membrane protein